MKIDITARNFVVDAKLKDYVEDKIGGLEKYLPRQSRGLAVANVVIEDDPNGREDNRFVCEVVVSIGAEQMVSREGTVNVYAAVDIVDAKLKAQFGKYKEKHTTEPRRARMLGRLTGRTSEVEQGAVDADRADDEAADPVV